MVGQIEMRSAREQWSRSERARTDCWHATGAGPVTRNTSKCPV